MTLILCVVERLPQFDPVAFQIPYPGKPSVTSLFAVRIDAHAGGGQIREQLVQIVHAKIEHEALRAVAEVFRPWREMGKDGHSGRLGPGKSQRPAVLLRDTEMIRYKAARASGSHAYRNTPPTRTALAMFTPPVE